MKTVLVLPDGNFLSHVSRSLEIANVLRKIEKTVIFAGEGKHMRLPYEAGFKVLPLKTLDLARALRISQAGRVNYFTFDMIRSFVEDELCVIRQVDPDLILSDFRLTASTSSELARKPLAVLMNAAWTNYFSAKQQAPEHSVFTRLLGSKLTTKFLPLARRLILHVDAAPFRKYRREKGLTRRSNFFDIMRGDVNLLTDIPEYFPTQNLPANFHYIGPITWEPDIDLPDLDRVDQQRPVLYITMGSSGKPRYLECALQVFENTEYQCLMTTAGLIRPKKIPSNFIVTDFAPGLQMMEKADAVICQGGNGTIYQALSKGTPIVGLPTTIDQDFNMDRVVSLGVGVLLHERHFQPEHMLTAVNQVLSENSFQRKASNLQSLLNGYNAPQTGAEILENYYLK